MLLNDDPISLQIAAVVSNYVILPTRSLEAFAVSCSAEPVKHLPLAGTKEEHR